MKPRSISTQLERTIRSLLGNFTQTLKMQVQDRGKEAKSLLCTLDRVNIGQHESKEGRPI